MTTTPRFEATDYCIQIDFERSTEQPARVFNAMAGLIDTFQQLDEDLARSISTSIRPVLLLQEIEAGSIKAWLRSAIESTDDEALKAGDWKKVVGSYLVKGKKVLLKHLDGKPTLQSPAEVSALQRDLVTLAQDTDMLRIPGYAPIPTQRLVIDLEKLGLSLAYLTGADAVEFVADGESVRVDRTFTIPPETVETLASDQILENTSTLILKVKKPDFLGRSMWEFHHAGRALTARLDDAPWLQDFQAGKVPVRPGDSLKVSVTTRVGYDQGGEVVFQHYYITKVLTVIPRDYWHQSTLLPDDDKPLK